MAAPRADRLSIPSLHKIHKQTDKSTARSDGSCGTVPSTPSTVASSARSAASRATPSSAGSWEDNTALSTASDWMPHGTHDGFSVSKSGEWSSPLRLSFGDEHLNPLQRASRIGTASPISRLSTQLDSGASLVVRPDEELLQTIRSDVVLGDGDAVEYIYEMIQEGEDVNQRSEHGFTPTAVAAAAGSSALLSLLLEKGADVTIASVDNAELPLHHAASLGHQVACQLLLAPTCAAGLLDATSAAGWTSLHLAVASGHERIVSMLLRAKAKPDMANSVIGNNTALHLATLGGHTEILELILERDCEANVIDSVGRTPLHLATMLADADCVALLLRNHADPLCRCGDDDKVAMDLVPMDRPGSARVHQLLSAYMRNAPPAPRTDARFDLPGGNDILSAYTYPVPWGLRGGPKPVGISSATVIEWEGEDDDAVWL